MEGVRGPRELAWLLMDTPSTVTVSLDRFTFNAGVMSTVPFTDTRRASINCRVRASAREF